MKQLSVFYTTIYEANRFAESVDVAMLAGPAGEALLAMTLVGRKIPSWQDGWKVGHAKITSSGEKRLIDALSQLEGRVYSKKTKTLPKDLEVLSAIPDFDLATFAFHLRRSDVSAHTGLLRSCFEGRIPDAYFEALLEKSSTFVHSKEPIASARFFALMRKNESKATQVVLLCPSGETLADCDDLAISKLTLHGVASLGENALPRVADLILERCTVSKIPPFASLCALRLNECDVGEVAPQSSLKELELRGGRLRVWPSANDIPLLRALRINGTESSALPDEYTQLPLESLWLRNVPLESVPDAMLDLESLMLPSMKFGTDGTFTARSASRAFGDSPVFPCFKRFEDAAFVEETTVDDASGPLGEALLAVALAGQTAARAAARKLVKKSKEKRLIDAMDALQKRNYTKKKDQKALAEDLEQIAVIERLNMAQLAYHLVQLESSAKSSARVYYEAHLPKSALREELELTLRTPNPAIFSSYRVSPARLIAVGSEYEVLRACGRVSLSASSPTEVPNFDGIEVRRLTLTGPFAGLDQLPATLKELVLKNVPAQSMAVLPILGSLTIVGGDWTNLPPKETLPKLESLELQGVELRNVPEYRLKSLELRDVKLETLPATLASLQRLSLHTVDVERLPDVPRQPVGELFTHALHVRGDVSENAAVFFNLPGTHRALGEFASFVDQSKSVPLVADALRDQKSLSELLVAVSRTYIDVEHGASTNGFLADQLKKHAGPLEAGVSAMLPHHLKTANAVEEYRARVAEEFEAFDFDAFVALVGAIVESEAHQSRLADWF